MSKKYNIKRSLNTAINRTPSLVDDAYTETIINPKTGNDIQFYIDPIYMLFNEQRLNKLGVENAQLWLESLISQGNNSIKELRKQCSDEQLIKMIRSRHLQHPSEILAWCRYMESNIEEFNNEVKAAVEAEKASVADTSSTETNTE